MGKDKKKESPIPKVKDKTISHEKKKLKTISKLTLESNPKENIKCFKKTNKSFKEPQKVSSTKNYIQASIPSTSSTSDEDAMEWEASEIQVLNTIQEIRREFLSRERTDIEQLYTSKLHKTTNSFSLCIVIDTNIFLSYLEIVKSLVVNSHFKSKAQMCVPWMVLQELDLMKTKNETKGKIEILARKAASFILEQSTANPNFRLQTLDEFRDCISSLTDEENADDKILQWCLKLKKEAKKDVCLLSNDKIFCAKATACGIPALQSQKIMDTLPSLLKNAQTTSGDCVIVPEPKSASEKETLELVKNSPVVNTCPDNFLEIFEDAVTPVLSQVIELEMKRVYEDLWINIVKIKPPWKFLDTLQCFEKHWIAVFSYVYSKDFKHKLEQLVTIWKKQHHVNCSQDKDVENLVETTVCILQFVKKVSKEVGKAIDRCIATLKTFQEKQPTLDDAYVLNLFTRIWDRINFVCGTLADVAGIPHNITYTRGACVPTAPEIEEGLRMLSPLFALLENAMTRYIEASDSKTLLIVSSREMSNCLLQAIAQLGLKLECPGDALQNSLMHFISNVQSKQLVTNGLEQLRNYMEVLHVVSLKLQS